MNRILQLICYLLFSCSFFSQENAQNVDSYIPIELANNPIYFEKLDVLTPFEMNRILSNESNGEQDNSFSLFINESNEKDALISKEDKLELMKAYNLIGYRKINQEIQKAIDKAKIDEVKFLHKRDLSENLNEDHRFSIVMFKQIDDYFLKNKKPVTFCIYDHKQKKYYKEFLDIEFLMTTLRNFYIYTSDIKESQLTQAQIDAYINRQGAIRKQTKLKKDGSKAGPIILFCLTGPLIGAIAFLVMN